MARVRGTRGIGIGSCPAFCPYTYKVWARGIDGDYRIAIELTATSL
jgi:hypothetical protein